MVDYLNTCGKEKVAFRTDWPVIDLERAMEEIDRLSLRPDAKDALLRGTALKLLRIRLRRR